MFKKCVQILQQLELDPTNLETVGRPEWLKGNLSGSMSRRISRSDRCVYQVMKKERVVKVLQMRFHY
ncbi:MAG: Toxin RelK [Firmicutes bacterium]|nr:Toxin RelK [Bacillota bacterium]